MIDIDAVGLQRGYGLTGETAGFSGLPGTDGTELTSAGTEMQAVPGQQRSAFPPNGKGQAAMCPGSTKHALYVERVLQGVDALIPEDGAVVLQLRHERVDVAAIRRAHPATTEFSALIFLADCPKLPGEHQILALQYPRFCRPQCQGKSAQSLSFHRLSERQRRLQYSPSGRGAECRSRRRAGNYGSRRSDPAVPSPPAPWTGVCR